MKTLRDYINLIESAQQGVAEGLEQVYNIVAVDKGNAMAKPKKLTYKAGSIEEVFDALAANDWYPLEINGVEVINGNHLKQGVAEGLGKDIKRLATGKDVKSRAGQEIAKSQDASMKGDTKTSKKHFDRYDKLDKLANKDQGVAEGSLEEYGDTANGQKMLGKVQKRAVDRATSKQADKDPKYAKKNQDTANASWERLKDKD